MSWQCRSIEKYHRLVITNRWIIPSRFQDLTEEDSLKYGLNWSQPSERMLRIAFMYEPKIHEPQHYMLHLKKDGKRILEGQSFILFAKDNYDNNSSTKKVDA